MRSRLVAAALAVILAVGGTLALVAYVRGADARALAGTRTVDVLVATQTIPKNTPAKSLVGLVAVKKLPEMAVLPNRVTSLEQLTGKVALTDLLAGEQLVSARFADPATARSQDQGGIPEGMQEVTVLLEPQRALGGHVAPGDTVGVVMSFSPPVKNYETHLRLQKVRVTRVQGTLAKADGKGSDAGESVPSPAPTEAFLVSLAVDVPMAERVLFAAEHGKIWLSNEPLSANEAGASVITPEGIFR
ncbi:Flp pilus assembly protein CpaB [Prescottella equi]|uniref:Flp pilus assembly protein CpaB n=1 Tax=Rhodococcus hoagii TaxID=43767 RepID=UPI0011A3FCA8|nr:RcpC/CpaB family pilus assembly protein [Prescottella equi]